MKKLRLSYSLLNTWDRGDVDGAVATYLHLARPTSRQINEGREIHEKIQKHIDTEGEFPDWFFNWKLGSPETEKELVVNYNEMFDLKCYIDCYDEGVVFEHKTGVSDSLTWTRTWQLPITFLICELAGVECNLGILVHYNQYNEKTDYTVMHNSKIQRDYARNIIDSTGPEIREYFLQKGLI